MRIPFSVAGSLAAGLVALLVALHAGGVQAAELPGADELQRGLGTPGRTVPVYEPHLSTGDRHVAVDYVGYPAVDVMALLFGDDWQGAARTVEFRALDGYVSRIDVGRFLEESAWLVFARKDGAPFTVDNVQQNETGVPLTPRHRWPARGPGPPGLLRYSATTAWPGGPAARPYQRIPPRTVTPCSAPEPAPDPDPGLAASRRVASTPSESECSRSDANRQPSRQSRAPPSPRPRPA